MLKSEIAETTNDSRVASRIYWSGQKSLSPAVLKGAMRHKTAALFGLLFLLANVFASAVGVDTKQSGLLKAIEFPGIINGQEARDNNWNPLRAFGHIPNHAQAKLNIVWIGNSQQHAINQPEPGDELASVELHFQLNGPTWPGRYPVFGMSYPNLGYAEIFSLVYALSRLGEKKPDVLILGLRFQDTKEIDFRKEFQDLITREFDEWGLQAYVSSQTRSEVIEHVQDSRRQIYLATTDDSSLEGRLSALTESIVPAYRYREQLQSLALTRLYWARNLILGIKTSSKRPMLKGRYHIAMQYLQLTLDVARDSGIRVLAYNIPLRPGVETPYIQSEYDDFRDEVRRLCDRHGVVFRDYDPLIPAEEWGIWDVAGEIDYMHFTGRAHKRLANAIFHELQPLLGDRSAIQ